jgi:uncharacterized protein (UPF0548 family)
LSHTTSVFHIRRPTEAAIQQQIRSLTGTPSRTPQFLSVNDGLKPPALGNLSYDQSRSCLGYGEATFSAAKRAFNQWQMFDLGWVRVANSAAPIARGQLVAVEVHSLGLWSLNISRILETVDSETRFGFLYSPTAHHVEQGEETFILHFDPATNEVRYEVEAVSRPRYILALLAYPITRHYQHRFAHDTHRRMRQAVTLKI